jgi:hypothetical protein
MAADKALLWLSANQQEDGSYVSYGNRNSESCSQVICALTAWGVDPESAAYTKPGGNIVEALLRFQVTSGAAKGQFCHILPNPDPGFATQQALYALGALKDFKENGHSKIFYRIQYKKENVSSIELYPSRPELEENTVFTLGVRNQNGNFIDNGEAVFQSSDEEVVSVDENGVLLARKKGGATITAKLKSDERVTAILEVSVVKREFTLETVQGAPGSANRSASFKLTNGGTEAQQAVCVSGLYDKASKALIEMNYIAKKFEPGESRVFKAEFNAPASGEYEIKVMVWNDWYKGRVLCEALIVTGGTAND